jgi:hypothetical protein
MAPAEPEDDAVGASRSLTWRLRRIALVLAVGLRLLVRLSRERSSRPDRHTSRRGSSIGSELCRQIHCFGPAELLMLASWGSRPWQASTLHIGLVLRRLDNSR